MSVAPRSVSVLTASALNRIDPASADGGPAMPAPIHVCLLTGGQDFHYAFGLATSLASAGASIDFVGSDDLDSPQLRSAPRLSFLNLRGSLRSDVGLLTKAKRILLFYARLVSYALRSKPGIFHILWNNKFQTVDRTLLTLYYRLLGKRVVLTAHNVNAARRDTMDTLLNRVTLRIQYRLAHHIFVHTDKMKAELQRDFAVASDKITVIRYGINNAVPVTDLTPEAAKRRLGIARQERTILFFGHIAPYKGLACLVDAFEQLLSDGGHYRLVIAGKPKKGCEAYWEAINARLGNGLAANRVVRTIRYIPDEELEVYFKAADVLTLPYTDIFQSGVLFLAYSFGLPVIAADVGSLRESIVEGRTGFVCGPGAAALACTLQRYFSSQLFRHLTLRRKDIQDYAAEEHSWTAVGRVTTGVYADLLKRR